MANGIISSTQNFPPADAAAPIGLDAAPKIAADPPPVEPLMKAALSAFHVIYENLGVAADTISKSLKQKNKAIADCTDLLNGLSGWNTPPFSKTPSSPLDPVNLDRVKKTDALYLNGISIPDSDYDAIAYAYGRPPTTGYSNLPIPALPQRNGKNDYDSMVVGQVYIDHTYGRPINFVWDGKSLSEPNSPLKLNTQSGTDFSALQPGDLVQDVDTGKYYRVANDKNGVEVGGYPFQKFVQTPGDDVIASLRAQISQKISSSSDLTKGDSIELQKATGTLGTTASIFGDIIKSITSVATNITTTKI